MKIPVQPRKPSMYLNTSQKYCIWDIMDENILTTFHAETETEAYQRALEQVGFRLIRIKKD